MLFLSEQEQREWTAFADEIFRDLPAPDSYDEKIRHNLVPAFHFYIAAFLAAKGAGGQAISWLETGTLAEEDGLFCCAFLLNFLQRHDNRLIMPARVFEDPRPFIHFAGVPVMKNARARFVQQCVHSLPVFKNPVRFMDIGCGDGALTVAVLSNLLETKKIPGIREILLVDPSPAMATLAGKTVSEAFSGTPVSIGNSRIQDCSGAIDQKIDIAMSSLAYHHMPIEDKRVHLARLKPWLDHFLLFELDANNDSPELFTPALALSVYQSYGRIMDFVFSHDAPVGIVNDCIDSFLMTEVVSFLTEPRGKRNDYHMLRGQWNTILHETLSPEFSLRCDSPCYADEYLSLFTLHYGRND